MRLYCFILFGGLLLSCNNASKKDPNQAMDDTARMDQPHVTAGTPGVIGPGKIAVCDIRAAVTCKSNFCEHWK